LWRRIHAITSISCGGKKKRKGKNKKVGSLYTSKKSKEEEKGGKGVFFGRRKGKGKKGEGRRRPISSSSSTEEGWKEGKEVKKGEGHAKASEALLPINLLLPPKGGGRKKGKIEGEKK